MKKILMLLLSCILMLSLTACGKKVTVESLMEGAAAKAEKASTMSMNMTMNADMEITAKDSTMKMGFGGDFKCESDEKNKLTHIDGNINYSAMGTESKIDFEAYTAPDDETMGIYLNVADNWMKQEVPIDDEIKKDMEKSEKSGKQLYDNLFGKADNLKLAEKTEKLDDKEVYVVSGELAIEDIISAMQSIDAMKDSAEDMQDALNEAKEEGFDFAAIPIEMKYYFDKKSKNWVKATIDLRGLLDEIMKKAMESVAALTGDASAASYEAKMSQFVIEFDDIQYDAVKEITVPDEAKNAPDMNNTDANPFGSLFGGAATSGSTDASDDAA